MRWWDEGVGVGHGLNRHSIDNADQRSLSKSDAESLTGITQQQAEFVRWWDEGVGVRLHAHSEVNADQRSPLSKSDAESLTGITQQQVSKWRRALRDCRGPWV